MLKLLISNRMTGQMKVTQRQQHRRHDEVTLPDARRRYCRGNAKLSYDRGLVHANFYSFKPFKWFKTFKPFSIGELDDLNCLDV